MAKPVLANIESKRKYAYAVLLGLMTRKEAYLTHIDTNCPTPARSASQLHKTQQMKEIFKEVQREIQNARMIEEATVEITKRQLVLAQSLLEEADSMPHKEKLSMLKSLKPIQDSATTILKRINTRYTTSKMPLKPLKSPSDEPHKRQRALGYIAS